LARLSLILPVNPGLGELWRFGEIRKNEPGRALVLRDR
jgi:hypothetical protein